MNGQVTESLKTEVKAYWNRASCETDQARSEKFSREYFEEIERFRYSSQPFIHSFAQFTRYRGKKVVEVGFGAGTDFIQWLRAGAIASGVDLTEEALDNLSHRIEVYGLPKPERIQVGDAEKLPFESNSFDLGYSWGVLHHSPDTEKAVSELVRVIRPGGEMKIMLYNRHSTCAFQGWIKFALLKGKPWKNLKWVMWNHQESIATKAYTKREVVQMLSSMGMTEIRIDPVMMDIELILKGFPAILRPFVRMAVKATEPWWGWSLAIYARKLPVPITNPKSPAPTPPTA
jgi:ubiquinone/menaquinone biosynthesis C-methylase UbiE